MDSFSRLEDDTIVTNVLKKRKLEIRLLFKGTNSLIGAINFKANRGELLRYLDLGAFAGNTDILAE
eukprot:snap_masked-scaffold_57-processed-gene-0.46-mRNA-1 protein AED:1.00 eAED:1.00 QI:0/-1/0/0/-1/1/1/0/65